MEITSGIEKVFLSTVRFGLVDGRCQLPALTDTLSSAHTHTTCNVSDDSMGRGIVPYKRAPSIKGQECVGMIWDIKNGGIVSSGQA